MHPGFPVTAVGHVATQPAGAADRGKACTDHKNVNKLGFSSHGCVFGVSVSTGSIGVTHVERCIIFGLMGFTPGRGEHSIRITFVSLSRVSTRPELKSPARLSECDTCSGEP